NKKSRKWTKERRWSSDFRLVTTCGSGIGVTKEAIVSFRLKCGNSTTIRAVTQVIPMVKVTRLMATCGGIATPVAECLGRVSKPLRLESLASVRTTAYDL